MRIPAAGPKPNFGLALFLFEWGMSANKLPNDKLLISIVDDDESVRKALGRLLSSLDFQAGTFDSGQEFLDSLADRWPDFVVLDLHMPGLTGLDVLQQLSRTRTRVPAVIITAFVCGLDPGSLSAVLCGIIAWYFFIPEFNSFAINTQGLVALGFYVFVVTVDVALIHLMTNTTISRSMSR